MYQEFPEPLADGTYVKLTHSNYDRVKVVEYRGRLGPKGARVYRLLLSTKPKMYTEVLEEQLVVLDESNPLPATK